MASTSSTTSLIPSRRSRPSTPENGLRENFFHDNLDREGAEEALRDGGFKEGLFLVRQSASVSGDFVLSVVVQGQVIHYQIQRKGEDALFTLSEGKKISHGLDSLVNYYMNEKQTGLQHSLTDWVPGSLAPPEARLHGTENLLHRACTEGNLVVVTELLSMGYRNLAAKNHESQTALHLASCHGHVEVVQQLLKYGAKVSSTDNAGDTALHVACQANRCNFLLFIFDFVLLSFPLFWPILY